MASLAAARAQAILRGLGIRPGAAAVKILVAWQAVEGVDAYANNPLATSNPSGADGHYNAVVRTYPTEAAGIRATVETLRGYPGIVAALRAGSPLRFLAQASELQTWCGCDGRRYAADIASRLGVPYTPPPGPPTPSPGRVIGGIGHAIGRLPPWFGWVVVGVPVGAIILDAIRRA